MPDGLDGRRFETPGKHGRSRSSPLLACALARALPRDWGAMAIFSFPLLASIQVRQAQLADRSSPLGGLTISANLPGLAMLFWAHRITAHQTTAIRQRR